MTTPLSTSSPRLRFLRLFAVVAFLACAWPAVSQETWVQSGPEAGSIRSLAIDPVNSAVVYAGTFRGGVFKSTDGGSHWDLLSRGLGTSFIVAVNDLQIDPRAPATVYAATFLSGVFKSTDGGVTWSPTRTGLTNFRTHSIALDPTVAGVLYVGTDAGVFRSANGAATWSPARGGIDNETITDIAIDPQTPSTLYAASDVSGLYKSLDSGTTWTSINDGLNSTFISDVALDPNSPSNIYVGAGNGVYKSSDGGASWNESGPIQANTFSLTVDPTTPNTLYVATSSPDLYRTTDGGASWSLLSGSLPTSEVTVIAVDPTTPAVLYVGTEETGLFKTTNAGEDWTASRRGFFSFRTRQIALDPTAGWLAYATGDNGGVFRSGDRGATWVESNSGLPTRIGSSVVFDPTDPNRLYASVDNSLIGTGGVFASTDGGGTWNPSSNGLTDNDIRDIVVDPQTPSTLYAAGPLSLFKSLDHGSTWSPLLEDQFAVFMLGLAIDPETPSTLYLATGSAGLLKSLDGGNSFSPINNGLPTGQIEAFGISPSAPSTLFTSVTGGGIHRSVDGGSSWQPMSTGFTSSQASDFAFDPQAPTTIYVAANLAGVFRSVDNGATWSLFGTGLDDFNTIYLAIDPGRTIYAGTYGNSVFTYTLPNAGDPTLTVVKAGDGAGKVTSEPATIDCGDTCSAAYPLDTEVTLVAVADEDSLFAGWSGGGCTGTATCIVPLGSTTTVTATFVPAAPCDGVICLNADRFQVDVDWRTTQGDTGSAKAVPGVRSDDSGVLYFFNRSNWEMLIKVLDGCAITDHFWVFAAATTDVQYTLTVTDTVTGQSKSYENPPGTAAASITDTAALAVCDSGNSATPNRVAHPIAQVQEVKPFHSSMDVLAKQGTCTDSSTQLCLNQSRFQVEVDWQTATGEAGVGQVVPFGADDSGLFYFFSARNWEMLVKVLDGCAISDHFWVFAAATTDVGYTLKVTDTMTGTVKEYVNPIGQAAPAITDTSAFATCQ